MKKRKLNIFLLTSALCLCFSIMGFGIYASKQASLTTSGTVGFNAHNCEVAIVGTIENAMRGKELNYVVVENNSYSNQGANNNETWQDKFDKGTEQDGTLKILSTNSVDIWNFGDIYFDDWNNEDDIIKSIIITLEITNYSDFMVKANLSVPTLDNISTSGSTLEIIIPKKSGTTAQTGVLQLCLTLVDENVEFVTSNLDLRVDIAKYITDTSSVDFNGYVSNGKFIINSVPSGSGQLIIPSTIIKNDKVYSVDSIEGVKTNSCAKNINTYSTVIIEEGIKSVGDSAFYGCSSLNSIVFPDSLERVEYMSFFQTTGLKSVNLNKLKYLGSQSFALTGIVDLEIPDTIDVLGVGAFRQSSVKTVKIYSPSYTYESAVLKGESMTSLIFYACKSLETVQYISDKVCSYSVGFREYDACTKLKSVTICDGLEYLDYRSFWGCTSLQSINLPEGLTEIGQYAFKGCTSLQNIKIPTTCKSVLRQAFANCTALINVEIPSTLENIMMFAFFSTPFSNNNVNTPKPCYDDSSKYYLTKISTDIADTTTIDNYEKVSILLSGASNAYWSNGWEDFGTNSTLTNLSFPNCEVIGGYSFILCDKLKSFDLPKLKYMGAGSFHSCNHLDVVLPKNLIFIGNQAFSKVDAGAGTTKITIPATTVQIGGEYFVGDNEENEIIGTHVFYRCVDATLKSFEVEEGNQHFVSHEGVLYTKNYKYLIAYPPLKESTDYVMPEGCIDCFEMAFGRTTVLKNLTLPNSFIIIDGRNREYKYSYHLGTRDNIMAGLYHSNVIENLYVKDDNPNYVSINGMLYTKDGKEFLAKAPYKFRYGTMVFADSCERLDYDACIFASGDGQINGIWFGGGPSKIILGENIKYISDIMLLRLNESSYTTRESNSPYFNVVDNVYVRV